MIARTALLAAAVASAAALPAAADAASPKISRTCSPPRTVTLSGSLAYGDGGFWTTGTPSRNAIGGNGKPTFVRVTGSCSVKSLAVPSKFRVTGALLPGLGGQIWASGDRDGTPFENVSIQGTGKPQVSTVTDDTNYLKSLAVVGGRGLGAIDGGRLSWWTGPGAGTEVDFPSAPAGGASLVATSDRVWMVVVGSFDGPSGVGYLLNGAADVTVISTGLSAGFSVNQLVVSNGAPWFTESDGSGNVKLGTVVGSSVVEYPLTGTVGSGLVAAPGGGVWMVDKASSKLLRFGTDGKQNASIKGPSGYRLGATATDGKQVAVLAVQPDNGSGAGASKLLLVR